MKFFALFAAVAVSAVQLEGAHQPNASPFAGMPSKVIVELCDQNDDNELSLKEAKQCLANYYKIAGSTKTPGKDKKFYQDFITNNWKKIAGDNGKMSVEELKKIHGH